MTYNLLIDVPASGRWKLTLSESALFAWIHSVPSWANKAILDGDVWYFASRNKAIEDTNKIITDKPDTIYRLYKSLQAKGVLRWRKIGEKDYIQITEKGKGWGFVSDKKTPLGNESELPRNEIRDDTDLNPTNYTISDSLISDDIERAPAQNSTEILVTLGHLPEPANLPDAPDWMTVAKQMLEYSKGEGKDQYQFLCESTRFTGDPMPIFATWAGKASPYELKNWKKQFSKLGTWFHNEAQRAKPKYQHAQTATQTTTQIMRDL